MKNKLTFNTLALGNLRQRRKQYTVMIIGIILAMVFSTSVILFIFSANETNTAKNQNDYGKQDFIVSGAELDEEFYQTVKQDKMVTDYGIAHIIGFGYTDKDGDPMGTAIGWMDDKCREISCQSLLEGRYPEAEDEIAVERVALVRLGIEPKVGEQITLKVKTQNGDEYLDTNEKTYTLVGIVKDKRSNLFSADSNYARFVPAAFVATGTQTRPGGKELISAYSVLPSGDTPHSDFWDYMEKETEGKNVEICDSFYYNRWSLMPFNSGNGAFAEIIALVLMLTSCLAIINSFNSNLKERKQQIGMLRAVGATKRQIKTIFAREAFIISLICTPISIALSYGLVMILLSLIETETVMTRSLAFLPVAAVVGIAVVMLASSIPLAFASRITPIQAIRDISVNRKIKTKKIKSKKQFNVSSHLAKRNMIFYKGGRIAVSVMLVASIVFSCFGFSYMSYAKDDIYEYSYDYEFWGLGEGYYNDNGINYNSYEKGMSDADKQDISAIPYVSRTYGDKNINAIMKVDEISEFNKCFYSTQNIYRSPYEYSYDAETGEYKETSVDEFTENYGKEFSEDYKYIKNKLGIENEYVPVNIKALDSYVIDGLDRYVSQGKINRDALTSGNEVILVAPKKAQYVLEFEGDAFDGGYSMSCEYGERLDQPRSSKWTRVVIAEGENTYRVGDTVDLSVVYADQYVDSEDGAMDYVPPIKEGSERVTDRKVKIGAIIYTEDAEDVKGLDSEYSPFYFLTTVQGLKNFSDTAKYEDLSIDVDTEITAEIDEIITGELERYKEKYDAFLISSFEQQQENEQYMKSMFVAMLALIIIGFTICASIINNTLTAGIRENKKELGTLRAFGASRADLVMSYVRQLLSMFSWGLGIGFGGFTVAYLIIYLVHKRNQTPMDLVFNPWITIGFCLILFAVCSFNLWFKIRKEMKNSIIENIREL